jgi:hypothetical protein
VTSKRGTKAFGMIWKATFLATRKIRVEGIAAVPTLVRNSRLSNSLLARVFSRGYRVRKI